MDAKQYVRAMDALTDAIVACLGYEHDISAVQDNFRERYAQDAIADAQAQVVKAEKAHDAILANDTMTPETKRFQAKQTDHAIILADMLLCRAKHA